MKNFPKLSFVIIGRNEAAHLADCVASVAQLDYPAEKKEIIFVDNDSTDNSLEIARRFPICVIALKQQPATPGRARNAGLAAATGEFLQFLDGDMKLHPDWIASALPAFEAPAIAAVVGHLQEVHPQKSLYNRLFNFGWQVAPDGEIEAPGGGGFFRVTALRQAGGYDETLFAAEETDLGYRLRAQQGQLVRLPALMAYHDMHMQSFGHFWRRGKRDGYWIMEVIRKYFNWTWPLPQSDIFKMDLQLLAFIALTLGFILLQQPLLAALLLVLPALFICKKAWYLYRLSGERRLSLLAALFNYINLLPVAWGQMRWLLEKI